MRQVQKIMGMPVAVEIPEAKSEELFQKVFSYFENVDARFSTYKQDSEISKINRGELESGQYSAEMREVLELAEKTKKEAGGYFDIKTPQGSIDPSGLVKGWAIYNAAKILEQFGCSDYLIDAGGDIHVRRDNPDKEAWRIGIQNPFDQEQIIKAIHLRHGGMATSGSYNRGAHIYNPLRPETELNEVVSITVLGPNVYEADRFATAAFAMGMKGVEFIGRLEGFEAYQIDSKGMALATPGFEKFVISQSNA